MYKFILVIVLSVLLFSCDRTADHSFSESSQIKKVDIDYELLPTSAFRKTDWTELLPEDDLNALLNPPEYLDEIIDGSSEDDLNNRLINTEDRYQQALASTNAIKMFHDSPIKIPAFIVPLEFDDNQNVVQFFMVPYFGACLHLPPPPPNQTIFVNYPQGIKLESLYDAFWVYGVLKTSVVENDIAKSAYSMEVHHLEIYTEE